MSAQPKSSQGMPAVLAHYLPSTHEKALSRRSF